MAWTLFEDLVKAAVVFVAGYLISTIRRAVMFDSPGLCLIKGCMRTTAKRGLCLVCYSAAKRVVEGGSTTWDQLVEMGLAQPEATPFDIAFKAATEKK